MESFSTLFILFLQQSCCWRSGRKMWRKVRAIQITKLMALRLTLFLGGITYVIFVASNLYPRFYTMLPAAALLGFGAAIFWAAQGVRLNVKPPVNVVISPLWQNTLQRKRLDSTVVW
jgi:hypothetical protein